MLRQQGMTLVEVLVTLLILKVGLLTVLAAQLQALRLTTDALQTTTAVALARDILPQLSSFHTTTDTALDVLPEAGMPPCASGCVDGDYRQHLLARWQQQWSTDSGYGLLLAPAFCLQQQAGHIRLQASWQQRSALSLASQHCGGGPGRAGLQVPAME